jgi:hypothetical protein
LKLLESYEAHKGTVVRVREGHWKSQFGDVRGTIRKPWASCAHGAVDVLLEDGSLRFFWLSDLSVVDEDIAVYPLGLVLVGHENIDGHNGFELPFGYYLELDADLLVLRRSDGSFVDAFNIRGANLFEVEWRVWEDAD